ncbi:MAG: SDR family oxidoreductase [Chitinophagaceae bacterium]
MNISLKGYRALVCGSTQGLGKAVAIEFAQAGAEVVLFARNEEALRKTLAELATPADQQHRYLVADFAEPEQVLQVVSKLATESTVHIVVNNTSGPNPGPVTDADPVSFTKAFNQHIVNYQQIAQQLIPGMKQAGYGRIINIVSTSVKIPIANLGVSNTIRAATAGWSKTLSLEVAKDGITVNNVLPGYTQTGRLDYIIAANAGKQQVSVKEMAERMKAQIPARRFGKPEELAAMVAFLASPAASYVNGTNIPVDGGSTGAF